MTNEGNDSLSYQASWYNLRAELLDTKTIGWDPVWFRVLWEIKYSGELRGILGWIKVESVSALPKR